MLEKRSEFIAEIIGVGLSIMCMLFIVMIVTVISVGLVAGFSAIFYCVENGPLIAIFLLLLFVIIMSFKKEWLEGKINEWEDGKINIGEKISDRIAMVYSDICVVIEILMAFLFLAGCFILPSACTIMIIAYFLGAL